VAHETFTVEVLTPDGEIFSDEVQMVSTKTTVGSLGILAHHQPLLGMLDPTELRLYRSDTDIVRFAQGEGYLQVTEDRVLILVEEAVDVASLDVAELQEKLRQADAELEHAEDGTEQQRMLRRDKRRHTAFLHLAGGD
jgi:F-type H+-transporting ATPase subunit epsilon